MRGIYWKIYLSFIFTSLVATAVTLAYAVLYRQISNEPNNLIAPTEGYISAAELMLQRGGEPLLQEWLLSFEAHASVNAYVFDQNGEDLLGSAPAEVRRYALSPSQRDIKVQPLDRSEVLVKTPIISLDGQYYLLVVEFIHPLVVLEADSYIYLGFSVSVLIFAVMGFWLSGYVARPLRSLRRTVRAITAGNLSARSSERLKQLNDEIGELGRDFDLMADRLQTVLADQKQLLRDISHELRSPLARLQIAVELARDEASPPVIEHLDRIELEAGRVNEQIGEILLLARLEVQDGDVTWPMIDVNQVLGDIIADAEFEQQGQNIEAHIQSQRHWVRADERMLRSAFENLIRNALLHTAPGTHIEVRVQSMGAYNLVSIRDHGPGVPEDHIEHLTKPFYRAEVARERNISATSTDLIQRGYGLGLAIAHRVVNSLGGRMVIRNHRQGGLEINCQLPASAEDDQFL